MHRLGLALSGGGFRATLYHLGVVRFLRDAEILPKVTHMTTVSGGSILGAHLALNWERYCGSEEEFDAAAQEVVRFVQLDVRNRIVRRFPLASSFNTLRRLFRLGSDRQLTRPGLLEKHYQQFLYGETSLFQLPEQPQLHMLATNLSEGRLCSFNREGLLRQRRTPGRRDRFERVRLGLATVPMAVAASSAFPGFFPPLELRSWDVGADEGEFSRQAFTDGGVFDNLGLRMFRFIEQSGVRDTAPLKARDFLELEAALAALTSADSLPDDAPLRQLHNMLVSTQSNGTPSAEASLLQHPPDELIAGLWEVIRSEELFRHPSFENMELSDPSAQSLLTYLSASEREPELSDRLWLNRHIVEAALRQVIGKPCLRTARGGFDGVLVSDAGAPFKVTADDRAPGLIRTSMRASDILMNRVWQLEVDAFEKSPGILFLPMTDVVSPSQDRHAPHPEIQRQVSRIRTDLDRFSDLEISTLVQHGYCIARKACRSKAAFFGTSMPGGPPWDPLRNGEPATSAAPNVAADLSEETQALVTARALRKSSLRRIWSTLFSRDDWPTFVWVPLLAVVMLFVPYVLYRLNEKAQQQSMVLTAIAETSPMYREILGLLEDGPPPSLGPAPFEEAETLEPPDFTGFEVISDTRVFDLRGWSDPNENTPPAFVHSRVRIRRTAGGGDDGHIRFHAMSHDEEFSFFCRTKSLDPVLRRKAEPDGRYTWEFDVDLSHIPIGGDTVLVIEGHPLPEAAEAVADEGRFQFSIPLDTGMAQIWMLMPENREYEYFEISGYEIGNPEQAEIIVPDKKVELPLGAIATFQLINPKANHRYECRWKWLDAGEEG